MVYSDVSGKETDVFAQLGRSHNNNETDSHRINEIGQFDFLRLFLSLKKWWWIIACIVAVVMAGTALVVYRMTPVYMASSVLEIKKKEQQIFDVSDIGAGVFDKEFFVTQIELLKSKSLASSVIDSLNLTSDPYFSWGGDGSIRDKKTRVGRVFSSKLHVTPVGRSRLIKVSFEHTNPQTAAHIANAMTDTFISYNMERKYNATSFARDFVEERLKITKETLEKSERDLVEYASENNLFAMTEGQGKAVTGFLDISALVELNGKLTAARTKSVEYKLKYDLALNRKNAAIVIESPTIMALKTQLLELNTEYLEKLALFKPDYPEMTELKLRIDYLDAQIDLETKLIQESDLVLLNNQYEVALEEERDLKQRVARLKDSIGDIRDKSIKYNILEREVDTNRSQYDALLQRLKEVSISDEIGSNLISLVDNAQVPKSPFKPNKPLIMTLAFLFSSLLGALVVFSIEKFDDRVKSPDDIKNKLKSIVMGVIPNIKVAEGVHKHLGDSQSSIAEAYASLRTNLRFSGPSGGPKVIHFTSTASGEGKSVSSLGLALRFAGLGESVLLIDADLRLPTFSAKEGQSIGLSGLLTSDANCKDNIYKTKYENLYLLPSGKIVPNPSEILSTFRLEEILTYARENFAHVIIDSPPVMGLADAPTLAAKCDATLLVVEASSMRTPAIKLSIERLQASGGKLLGVILTKYKAPTKGYLNYYQYSYGENTISSQGSKTGKKSKAAIQKEYIDIT